MFNYLAIGHHTRGITEKVMPLNQSAISTLVGCPPIEDGAFSLRCQMLCEIWKTIEDFPDYEISSLGRVKSKKRKGRILRLNPDKNGYHQVYLRHSLKTYTKKVHRLVLDAFKGKAPKGFEACHYDGIPNHNTIDNLRWDTYKNNRLDMVRHGRSTRGEKHPSVKFTRTQIREIRGKYKSGRYLQRELAQKYNTGQSYISQIVRQDRWRWL